MLYWFMRKYKQLPKIFLCLMIIGLCQVSPVKAGKLFDITIKGGLSYASQDWSYTESSINFDEKSRAGFRIGVYMDRSLAGFISYRIGLDFMQLGSKEEIPVTGMDSPEIIDYLDIDRRLDYLSLPLQVKISTKLLKLPTYIYLGPSLNFLLNRSPHAQSFDFDNIIFGGEVGLGQEFNLFKDFPLFLIEIYYYHDLNNAFEDTFLTIKSHSLGIVAGFKF